MGSFRLIYDSGIEERVFYGEVLAEEIELSCGELDPIMVGMRHRFW
jgi:hypothetical protein